MAVNVLCIHNVPDADVRGSGRRVQRAPADLAKARKGAGECVFASAVPVPAHVYVNARSTALPVTGGPNVGRTPVGPPAAVPDPSSAVPAPAAADPDVRGVRRRRLRLCLRRRWRLVGVCRLVGLFVASLRRLRRLRRLHHDHPSRRAAHGKNHREPREAHERCWRRWRHTGKPTREKKHGPFRSKGRTGAQGRAARRYPPGGVPVTRPKARLNEMAESYPTWFATSAMATPVQKATPDEAVLHPWHLLALSPHRRP